MINDRNFPTARSPDKRSNSSITFGAGALLISLFHFRGLEAVIVNKAASLVVVATALPFRAAAVPLAEVAVQWPTT